MGRKRKKHRSHTLHIGQQSSHPMLFTKDSLLSMSALGVLPAMLLDWGDTDRLFDRLNQRHVCKELTH